jgi:hypothetical protein
MEEGIIKIIKENAGIVLADWALINPEKVSKEITLRVMKFIEWQNSDTFEYYTFEDLYKYWENNIT